MNFTWTNGRSLETVTKGDLTTSYKYNQDNLRTSKTVNGVTTTYIWEDSTLIAEETSGIVTWYIYDDNGSVIGFQRQESADSKTFTTYYYEKNLQGDIVAIYGEDGTELAGYTYSAWGEITGITGDENLAKSNPWRYRGYYYDEEIGMYYLQSRYYDAEVGRFLNADDAEMLLLSTLGLKGSNLFEYCDGNPVNNIDPTGYLKVNTQWIATVIDIACVLIPAIITLQIQLRKGRTIAKTLAALTRLLKYKCKKALKRVDDWLFCLCSINSHYIFLKWTSVLTVTLISKLCSIGNIIAYFIDCLDGRWDGYLDTKKKLKFQIIFRKS